MPLGRTAARIGAVGNDYPRDAAGADGIMVEVHNNPSCALCDGAQSLTPVQFAELNKKISLVREAVK